jgi:hypothetical protein
MRLLRIHRAAGLANLRLFAAQEKGCRLWRVWIGGRKANLRVVRQAVLSLTDTIYAVPISRREDQQAWSYASAVAVMRSAEVRPDLDRVALTILGTCLEAADALQVHFCPVGALVRRLVFGV